MAATSLLAWFEKFTKQTGERPTHIVFGVHEFSYVKDEWPDLPDGVVQFGAVPAEVLTRAFDDGFGGNDSPNLCAWSESWVLFSDNYDGAEGLEWVPRNPVDHEPIRPGGG